MLANVESSGDEAVSLLSSVKILRAVSIFVRLYSFANVLDSSVVGECIQSSDKSALFVKKLAELIDVFFVHKVINREKRLCFLVNPAFAKSFFDPSKNRISIC